VNTKKRELVLIGGLPIEIVHTIAHALGKTAVGHAIGEGVRIYQNQKSVEPERVQLKGRFLSQDRYTHKLILETLHQSKVPFPFVSGLTNFTLATFESLVFTQSSSIKSQNGGPVVDFVATLAEYKQSILKRFIGKTSWVSWSLATHRDPNTKNKLTTTSPTGEDQAAVQLSEYIKISIDTITVVENWSDLNIIAANELNNRYHKLPINQDGVFPQLVKVVYPPSSAEYQKFNDVANLPNDYAGYTMPVYNDAQIKIITITLTPKETSNGIYTVMKVDLDGIVYFNRKVVPKYKYNIEGYCEISFSEIVVKSNNISPENLVGGQYGSKVSGGLRLKQ